MSGIKAIPLAIQKKPISLQISAARKTLYTHTLSRSTPFEKNISSCLTNKPTRVNRCTHPLCVFALTPAIANLHERLESSKQWGKRSAAYYSSLLIPLTCVPPLSARNAFHLLSGRTIPLVLCWGLSFFFCSRKTEMMRRSNVPCFPINFPYVADKWLYRPQSRQEAIHCELQFLPFIHI